jgi:hypothetical protein
MLRIEKDIRFIEDYIEQSLKEKALPPEQLLRFKIDKSNAVATYVEKLRSLQVLPVSLPFDQVNAWRQQLDDARAMHFERALQEIDSD